MLPAMNSPEAYIQFTPGMITDEWMVTVASTEGFLRNSMAEFAEFMSTRRRHAGPK
jgi:chromate reductase